MDGDTIGYKETPVNVNRLAPKLLALRDGETIRERDFWEKRLVYPWDYETHGLDWGKYISTGRSDVDLFGFAGNAKLVGDGNFSFTRKDDRIEFRGLVDHLFDEPYNFEAGTSFWKPYALGPLDRIYGDDGLLLAQHGRAAEYRMKSTWPQQATGTLRIDPNGKLSWSPLNGPTSIPMRSIHGPDSAKSSLSVVPHKGRDADADLPSPHRKTEALLLIKNCELRDVAESKSDEARSACFRPRRCRC